LDRQVDAELRLPGELRGFRFDAADEPFAEIELDSLEEV